MAGTATALPESGQADSTNARELLIELDEAGVLTKATVTKSGLGRGGIAFARGSQLHLLGNRFYIRETRHRGAHYPGEHDAIVPR